MNKYLHTAFFIVFCSIIAIFLNQYISQESVYDNYRFYAYHLNYCIGTDIIKDNGVFNLFTMFLTEIKKTISSFLPVYLLSFFGIFLGKSRMVFINLLFYIYLLPSIYLIVFLYKKFINDSKDTIADILKYIVIFFCILFWFPTLRGLPDIAALLPFCLLMYISMKTNFAEKISIDRMVSLGFICFLCLIFRRTFSTAILSWFSSLFLYYLILGLKNIKTDGAKNALKKILFVFTNMFIMSCIFFVLFAGITSHLFEYFLSGNLAKEMSYYHSLSTIEEIKILYSYINPIMLILALLPLIFALVKKTYKIKPLLKLSYIFIFVYFTLFLFLQDFVIENYIPMAIFINIILFASIDNLCDLCRNIYIKSVFALLVIAFCTFNFYQFFFIEEGKLPYQLLSHYYISGTPLINENKNSFHKLYDILKDKVSQNPKAKISTIASSRLFSWETIKYQAYVNNDIQLANNIEKMSVLNVGGLYFQGYNVDYLINVTPWGNNVSPENWLPISLVNDDFQNGTGISKSYTKIDEFKTDDNNYTITLYEKTSPVDLKDLESIIDRFLEAEPSQKDSVMQEYERYLNERNTRNNHPGLG